MKIDWNTMFEIEKNAGVWDFTLKSLEYDDYKTIIGLISRVLWDPKKFESISVKDGIGPLTDRAKVLIEHLRLIMDCVTWDIMFVY